MSEHLIMADTGWIDATALLSNGWALGQAGGHVHVKRRGSTVTWSFLNVRKDGATGTSQQRPITGIPSGYRPRNSGRTVMIPVVLVTGGTEQSPTGYAPSYLSVRQYERDISTPSPIPGHIGSQYTYVEISYETADPWPTVLPGPAV